MNKAGGWTAGLIGGLVGAGLATAGIMLSLRGGYGEQLVRSTLVDHPDILQDASLSMQARQHEPVLRANAAKFTTPFASSWKGAAKGDVTLTYFFDYACGYCRQSNPALERLLAEDKGLRIIYRELPILGEASFYAARASLAASKAGRFAAYHDALSAKGQPTPDNITAAATASGTPASPGNDPEIDRELKENYNLAGQLGATGTPLFVVGDQVINSAVGYEGLKAAIDRARRG